MTWCVWFEMSAAIDVQLGSPGLDLQEVIDKIWSAQAAMPEILVQSVGTSFGPADVTVIVKTRFPRSASDPHPSWVIAQFVQRLHNVEHVTGTQTRILVRDPNHDLRESDNKKTYLQQYNDYWRKRGYSEDSTL